MIGVEEAKRRMMAEVVVRPMERRALVRALGHVVCEAMRSPDHYPRFDVTAVDGYAVGSVEGPWTVIGVLAAGEVASTPVMPGEAVRIFTGAMVPQGTVAVLMQEYCIREQGTLRHTAAGLNAGANIRREGESVRKGEVVVEAGSVLSVAAIGALASCGVREVCTTSKPHVAVLRTGGEFIELGKDTTGRIHSSNEHMLEAALRVEGCTAEVHTAHDEEEALVEAIQQAAAHGDVLITTGGVSVGDHDLLPAVMKKLGATIHFHGVAQKPGKPMLFATVLGRPVFALPGNPRAVLVLYHEYVLPFLRAVQGVPAPFLREEELPLAAPLEVKGQRAEFRAGLVRGGRVELLADEGSHMLRTLLVANALVYLPADRRSWAAGDPVIVHHLP